MMFDSTRNSQSSLSFLYVRSLSFVASMVVAGASLFAFGSILTTHAEEDTYLSTLVSAPQEINGQKKDLVPVTVQLLNTGTATWFRESATPVRLATSHSRDHQSPFYDSSTWLSSTRISMVEESVAPGQTATFQFNVTIPGQDIYKEYFQLVVDGLTWMNDNELAIVVNEKRAKLDADILESVSWSTNGQFLKSTISNIEKLSNLNTSLPDYDYDVIYNSAFVTMDPNGRGVATLTLKNAGKKIWTKMHDPHLFRLATSRPQDRASILYDSMSWVSPGRINMDQSYVLPGENATFTFYFQAPAEPQVYREYFQPVVEWASWLPDKNIYWDIQIGGADLLSLANLTVSGAGHVEKRIEIDISDQTLTLFENDIEVNKHQISSGKLSMPTPLGNFKICHKQEVRYSNTYHLYMPSWMAFTCNNAYGIHGLPYWKLRSGILEEGRDHIGRRVSHGCVRLLPEIASGVFEWVEIGTPVNIHN